MSPKVTNLFWATFVNKFVAKNFKQSPNLVTLIKTTIDRFSRRRKTNQNCAKKFGQKEMRLIDPVYFCHRSHCMMVHICHDGSTYGD